MSTSSRSHLPGPDPQDILASKHSTDNPSTSSHPPTTKPDPTTSSAAAGSTPSVNSKDHGPAAPGGLAATASSSAQFSRLQIRLRNALRQYSDFPSPGILFEDFLPIFTDPSLHAALIDALEIHVREAFGDARRPDVIVGLEARGLLFGPSLALRLGAGFVPVRKPGKLPGDTLTASFKKEYGDDYFQIQRDAITSGQKVIVVDDVIATGGSAAAAGSLVRQAGGHLLSYIFILELDFLKGREKLPAPAFTLLASQSTT